MVWRLADAKNRFSELFSRALSEGPQRVRRHNGTVVILSEEDYERLAGQRPAFKDFLLAPGPSLQGVDLSRDPSRSRDIEL